MNSLVAKALGFDLVLQRLTSKPRVTRNIDINNNNNNNNNNNSNSNNNRMLVNVERKFEKIYGCQLTCLCRRVPCRKRRAQLLKESMKSEKNQ